MAKAKKAQYTEEERNSLINAIRELNTSSAMLNGVVMYLLLENPDLFKSFKTKIKKYDLETLEKKRVKVDEFLIAVNEFQDRISKEVQERVEKEVKESKEEK